jgi:hypothetical protein
MPKNTRTVRSVSTFVLALLLACSCASGGGSKAASGATAKKPAFADAYTCASVQALLGHLAVSTTHWSPTLHPYDVAVAQQIRTTSVDLQKQLPKVRTVAVMRAVMSSAQAFNAVATAMVQKKRAQVDHAISTTRVAYRNLKKVCGPA